MANDHKELLKAARESLKVAVDDQTDRPHANVYALASIAASLIVIAEQAAGGEEEREEHHVH
jgi:hypothetical protein